MDQQPQVSPISPTLEATPGQTSPTAAQTAGSSPDLPKPLPKHPDLQRPPAAAG